METNLDESHSRTGDSDIRRVGQYFDLFEKEWTEGDAGGPEACRQARPFGGLPIGGEQEKGRKGEREAKGK